MSERNREFLQIDATFQYQKELDDRLREQFPFVGGEEGQDILGRYKSGDLIYASFKPDLLTKDRLTRQVVSIALRRAANPNDPAHCRHGADHEVFKEAVDALIDAVKNGRVETNWVPVLINGQDEKPKYKAQRLCLLTPVFQRQVSRPVPFLAAKDLSKPSGESVGKAVRRMARENGIGFALLVCGYACMEPKDIMGVLGEENLKRELKDARRPYVSPKRQDDWKLVWEILDRITVLARDGKRFPRYSAEAYKEALKILENKNLVPKGVMGEENFSFVTTTMSARAVAIFAGMSEAAQKFADPSYFDPACTAYIDREYGGISTTLMVTAYLKEAKNGF